MTLAIAFYLYTHLKNDRTNWWIRRRVSTLFKVIFSLLVGVGFDFLLSKTSVVHPYKEVDSTTMFNITYGFLISLIIIIFLVWSARRAFPLVKKCIAALDKEVENTYNR